MSQMLWRLTACGLLWQALTTLTQGEEGPPIRVFLIQNKSDTKTISFEIRGRSETQWRKHVLEPQKAYFYDDKVNVMRLTAISNKPHDVEPGFLYELHPNPKSDEWGVVRRSFVSGSEVSPAAESGAVADTWKRRYEQALRDHEVTLKELTRVRQEATARSPLNDEVQVVRESRQLSEDKLVVLSWPAGASVWLTSLANSAARGDRRLVGTTPFAARVADGTYRVELTHAEAQGEGLWAGPSGRGFTTIDQDRSVRWWSAEVTKSKDRPALVQALWLRPIGTPLEQLTTTVGNAPTLFDIGRADEFENTAGIVFGRCGVKLTNAELQRLRQVAQRTGFLRYELSKGQTALEMDFTHPIANQPFQAHVVRVGDSRQEIPISARNSKSPVSSQK